MSDYNPDIEQSKINFLLHKLINSSVHDEDFLDKFDRVHTIIRHLWVAHQYGYDIKFIKSERANDND